MADILAHEFFMNIAGSNKSGTPGSNKISTVSFRVSLADAQAFAAADNVGETLITNLGILMLAIGTIIKGAIVGYGVKTVVYNDIALPGPDDAAYTFDKVNVHYQAGQDNYMFTIPTRDDAAFIVESDGVSVDLADGGDVQALVAALNGTIIGKNGTAGTVTRMTVTR